jgi:hypothetical protein
MPHPLTVDGGKRSLMIAALRYYDTFAKMDGTWLFAERLLYVPGSKNAFGHDSEQPGVFPSENCDRESGAPCHRRREWNGRWISPSLRDREPCRRRCDRHWAQEARHLPPQAERSSRWRSQTAPQRIPSWPGPLCFNAGRIHLRTPTCYLIFRLRQSGGPYIPVSP